MIHHGDLFDVLPTLDAESIDACVTDPPYGLEFMGQEWDKLGGSFSAPRGNGEWAALHNTTRKGFDGYGLLPTYVGGGNIKCPECGRPVDGRDPQREDKRKGYRCVCGGAKRERQKLASRSIQDWHEHWAREVYRVLKPGAYLCAFGGTRTSHRMVCAIEDAGFEIRDCLSYLYGSGFPKSSRVNRDPRFCQCAGLGRNDGCIIRVQSPDDHSDMATDVGGGGPLFSDAHRSTHTESDSLDDYQQGSGLNGGQLRGPVGADQVSVPSPECAQEHSHSSERADDLVGEPKYSPSPVQYTDHLSNQDSVRPDCSESEGAAHTQESTLPADTCESDSRTPDKNHNVSPGNYAIGLPRCRKCLKPTADGMGTALKPAWEPIILARKPMRGTVAANVLTYGTGALNIDACRIGIDEIRSSGTTGMDARRFREGTRPTDYNASQECSTHIGRWPANVVLDEEAALVLDAQSGELHGHGSTQHGGSSTAFFGNGRIEPGSSENGGESGGASRFYYIAKPSREERDFGCEARGNRHPTVKPVALMRWLVRLVTPINGVVLDPFAGSGTTGMACIYEQRRFIGIEREAEYFAIAQRRIAAVAPLFNSESDGAA